MRLRPNLLFIGIAGFGAIAAPNSEGQGVLLTFDTLTAESPSDVNVAAVPNGYGGLDWNNFGVINGLKSEPSYGYWNGVVSPDNVAYNPFGNPASISDGGSLFNFDSGYLTAALNIGRQSVQVEGFQGSRLLYNNTYILNDTSPTLINFNYYGVDMVQFSSFSQPFVMDNVTVGIVPEPNTIELMILGGAGLCSRRFLRNKRQS